MYTLKLFVFSVFDFIISTESEGGRRLSSAYTVSMSCLREIIKLVENNL